ncbi:hypothetical protein AcV5_008426 [Taiwanofungus camphoratus]|nr:hypothetical protein AcV5_008426 [Antrodia cinnamomea]KAI0955873.1 hypothetical protein AcV7_006417 [Antrodia cinnamomea]
MLGGSTPGCQLLWWIQYFKRLSLPWLVCLTLTIHLDDIILHVVVFRSIKLVCRVW